MEKGAAMDWHQLFERVVVPIQSIISFAGTLIILSGILIALFQYLRLACSKQLSKTSIGINPIRLNLGRNLILGLEFIVASDLISTTTAPDYYSVGIVAVIVLIRTVLSFSLNRELMTINQEPILPTT
jgi:uncharacterized membrane protein